MATGSSLTQNYSRSQSERSWSRICDQRVMSSSPGATEYPLCRGLMFVKSVDAQNPPFGVCGSLEERELVN
ncbi:hypothetical protein TNCV_2243771 [Trichonephila clavipes]|nr:hypothetical protein TNCV_2243771 [Trichonephila clavipes]